MAFENVDVNSLRNSLNSCKNTINTTFGRSFINSNNNFWTGDAKNNLVRTMNKLYTGNFKILEDKLNHYLSVVNVIQRYKDVQNEINNLNYQIGQLQSEINNLKPKLKYWDQYANDKGHWGTDGEWIQEWEGDWVVNHDVENQINSKENQINIKREEIRNKEQELQQLEAQVNSMI